MRIYHFLVCVVVMFFTTTGFSKQELTSEQISFFENKVRPILAEKCLECHSAEKGKIKGGLVLDSRVDILKGGESGPVYNESNIEKSSLIKAINWEGDVQMPEKGKMSQEEINILTEWFRQGIPDPRVKQAKFDKSSHWAFQPLVKPEIPAVKNISWCNNPIDCFILAKLEANKMFPATQANKEVFDGCAWI